jgi:hypothetical protein
MQKDKRAKYPYLSDSANLTLLRRSTESVLILLAGLLGLAVLSFILFVVSFAIDPVSPNVSIQLVAIVALVFGATAILALIVFRHREMFTSSSNYKEG